MKVLFVTSGNSKFYRIAPFIRSQGESLKDKGVDLTYFTVEGKGVMGYVKSAIRLRRFLKNRNFDLIHAHYSLSGWVAVLSFPGKPILLSLMGDDAQGRFLQKNRLYLKTRFLLGLTRLIQPFVQAIIVKSENLAEIVYRKQIVHLLPNGVNLDQFRMLSQQDCREELGLSPEKKYVLFLGNPADSNKNIGLVRSALDLIGRPEIELINVYKANHEEIVRYMNAADVFTLCSLTEGSPNVVKEAMACGCPLVVTRVGDTAEVVGETPGCFVSSHDSMEFAGKLSRALLFAETYGRTHGRARILELGLDNADIADRLIAIYNTLTKYPLQTKQLDPCVE